MSKSAIKQLLIWFRNGFSFVTAWFLILLLTRNLMLDVGIISTEFLFKMLVSIAGGVFIFCVIFSSAVIKRWKFHTRLTVFMTAIGLYECACFYWMGLFSGEGTLLQYVIFVGIIMVFYLICMAIYYGHYKKRGELYTAALKRYQER